MSILETFYILFKSDADQAAKGLDKVDDAADKAEKSLKGADKATKGTAASAKAAASSTAVLSATTATADANAKRLAASFMGVARAIAGPLLALVSINSLSSIATGRAEEIRELDQFSAKLNSTIGDVDAFKRAVQGMGGDGSRALDSLVKIGEKVNEAFSDEKSGARKDFESWGLAFKDAKGHALGASDAMLALASNVDKVSRAEALARIKKLGIEDPASIELILKGRKEVERYIQTQKDLGVVTEAQAEVTRKYYSAMGELGNRLGGVGNKIAETLLPGMTSTLEVLSRLVDWAGKNQHLVEGFFIGVAGVITTWLLPAMIRLGIATLAATWPYLLLIAAIGAIGVAFALAWDDFQAWANGQPSVLGDLLGDYKTFVKNLQGLFDAFSWDGFLLDLANIKKFFADAFSIDGFLADIESLKAAFVSLGQTITDAVGGAIQRVIDLIAGIPGAIKAAVVAIPAIVAGVGPNIAAVDAAREGSQAGATIGAMVQPGQMMLNSASGAPQGIAAPGGSNVTTNVSVGTVTVNTQATDAAGVAAAVKGALQNEFRSTSSSLDDGVAK